MGQEATTQGWAMPQARLDALRARARGEVVCVLGPSGEAKARLVRAVLGDDPGAAVLGADVGQACWGAPGCVGLWRDGEVVCEAFVGSLDPLKVVGRYMAAVARLSREATPGATLMVDVPGVSRGRAALNLMRDMVVALRPALALVLWEGEALGWATRALAGLPVETIALDAAWRRPTRSARRRLRTEAMEAALRDAAVVRLDAGAVVVEGFHPSRDAWRDRLVGLMDPWGDTLAVGRVVGVAEEDYEAPREALHHALDILAPIDPDVLGRVSSLVVGDVLMTEERGVHTARAPKSPRPKVAATWATVERPRLPVPVAWPAHGGDASYEPRLLNSLFGDPGLMLRQRSGGRALVLDLGWLEESLPGKVLHGVTDVFVSHGHMDHLQGLVSLLRALMGPGGSVRLYGPPALERLVTHLAGAFRFNLFAEGEGPELWVHTLRGDRLKTVRVECADPARVVEVGEREVRDGLIVDEGDALQVRAVELQHSVPVLAYRVRTPTRRGPDHPYTYQTHYDLAYITDIADTPDNRARAVAFARDADLLVCESTFTQADHARAAQTRHLTSRACAEIARDARVKRLVPFHFSPRYQDQPEQVYAEILSIFPHVAPAVRVPLRPATPPKRAG